MLPAVFRTHLKDAEFLFQLRHGKNMCCLIWSCFEAFHVEFDELDVNKNIFLFPLFVHWSLATILSFEMKHKNE